MYISYLFPACYTLLVRILSRAYIVFMLVFSTKNIYFNLMFLCFAFRFKVNSKQNYIFIKIMNFLLRGSETTVSN